VNQKKCQVAMEFLMMIIIAVALAVILGSIAYYYVHDYSERRNVQRVLDFGYSLQNEVILAHTVEPGFERVVKVPQQIGTVNVEISNVEDEIYLRYKGSDYAFRIPPTQGSFAVGNNKIARLESGGVRLN
jgi:hypothetical protein